MLRLLIFLNHKIESVSEQIGTETETDVVGTETTEKIVRL